jgi:hypothetical protein
VPVCGVNQYGYDAGGSWTQAKTTPIAFAIGGHYQGSGEHFLYTFDGSCYGMSDAFVTSGQFRYSGGPIAGDEGQGFSPAIYCYQNNSLALAIIQSVTRTTFSTTVNVTTAPPGWSLTTYAILGSIHPQVIPVVSTTGANVGDWIVFNQSLPNIYENMCAAQITAVDPANKTRPCWFIGFSI